MNGRTDYYFNEIEEITQKRKLYFAKLHLLKALIEEGKKKAAIDLIETELLHE